MMIDGMTLSLGQHRILGCPYHGLVVGNRLTLPNGQHLDNKWNTFQVRGAYRLAVPGVAAITRSPEQAAEDALRGYLWRTDTVVWLRSNGQSQSLYGRLPINTPGIYSAGPGQCWSIAMPYMPYANESFTALNAPATMATLGRIDADPDERSVSVGLSGYGAGRFPPENFLALDCASAGNRMLVGDTLNYDAVHDMYVQGGGRMALLQCSGTGTEGNPLRLTLEFVADQSSGAATTADDFVLFDGVWEWQPEITIEWIPPKQPQPDSCEWMLRRTTGYNLVYLPKNPDIPQPYNWIRFITGTRAASLEGHVLGGWLDASGAPVLVTCDIAYHFEAGHHMSCQRSSQVDKEEVFRYFEVGGQCSLDGSWGDQQYNVAGVFASNGSYGASTVERITYTLKVGGVAVDEYVIEHLFEEQAQLYGSSTPPMSGSAAITQTYTLKLNDQVIDQFVSPSPAGPDTPAFGRNLLVQAVLDRNNRFGQEPVEQWLPVVAASEHRLMEVIGGDGTQYGPSVAVQLAPHWWSNNMVCLATRQRPWQLSLGGGTRTYGPTAHPGGVVAGSITVTAPSNAQPPPPRFGARSPLTGTVVVGQTQRIQYV